jgi:hypothetical protein
MGLLDLEVVPVDGGGVVHELVHLIGVGLQVVTAPGATGSDAPFANIVGGLR